MTPARKRRIHASQQDADGVTRCGNRCGAEVPVEGEGVIYEHVIPFNWRPDLDDDGPNVQAWCAPCSAQKNRKGNDPTKIAKTKRQERMRLDHPRHEPKMRSSGKLQSRGFQQGHRPLQSRNTLRRKP